MIRLVFVLALLSGCAGMDWRSAALVANEGASLGWAVAAELERDCMAPMRAAAAARDADAADAIATRCRPKLVAYEGLVGTHHLVVAAIRGGADEDVAGALAELAAAVSRFRSLAPSETP